MKSRLLCLAVSACLLAVFLPAIGQEAKAPEKKIPFAGTGRVTQPVRVKGSGKEPEYPDKARAKGIEGKVALQAVIQKDGTVGAIEVLKVPEGDLGFKEAAIEAVRSWRYEPARLDGEPVDVYFHVIVDFTLGDKEPKPEKKGKSATLD